LFAGGEGEIPGADGFGEEEFFEFGSSLMHARRLAVRSGRFKAQAPKEKIFRIALFSVKIFIFPHTWNPICWIGGSLAVAPLPCPGLRSISHHEDPDCQPR
jgi:hypothetical protein